MLPKGVPVMLGSVVLFTACALLTKYLTVAYQMDVWTISVLRASGGFLLLGLYFIPAGKCDVAAVFKNKVLILRGIMGGVGITLYYFTIVHLDVGRATVINSTYPIFAALFAIVALKEALSLRRFLWMLVTFAGICILLGFGGMTGFGKIELVAILGAVVAGICVVLIKFLSGRMHFSTVYAGQCVYGLLIAIVPGVLSETSVLFRLSMEGYVMGLLGGILVSCGQLTMTYAYQSLRVSQGATMQLLVPLLVVVGGVLLYGEMLTVLDALAMLLVMVGCLQVIRRKNREE